MNARAEGEKLIGEARRIYDRDLQNALVERDYNLAIRRAQEVVELTLKGALRVLGVDYPKVHDVAPVFAEQVRQKVGRADEEALQRVEDISLWLAQARAPSFYFERDYGEADARKAQGDAGFVLAQVRKILDEYV